MPTDEWTLRRDGPDWLLLDGAEQARLRDCRVDYRRAVPAAAGREITALDLVAGGAGLIEPRGTAARHRGTRRLSQAPDLNVINGAASAAIAAMPLHQ